MSGPGYRDAALDEVYQLVRGRILRGELEPGLRISSVKLADALGVSRTPLREALRLLEREGLVVGERNRMLRVADLSLDDLDDLFALRIANETAAIRQTVPRLDAADLGELDALLAEMDGYAARHDVGGWRDPHRRLHRKLCSGAGPRAVALIDDLRDHADRYTRFYGPEEPLAWSAGKGEHERIVDACREDDPERAAVRLARHLAHTALAFFAVAAPEHRPWRVHEATTVVTGRSADPGGKARGGRAAARRAG